MLESIILSLNLIKDEIRYKGSPMRTVIKNAAKAHTSIQLPFFKKCSTYLENRSDMNFTDAWKKSIGETEEDMALKQPELDALMQFGEGLGKSDTNGQLAHCGYYISVFSDYLLHAKQDKDKYSKLYSSLSLLSGTLVIILFI